MGNNTNTIWPSLILLIFTAYAYFGYRPPLDTDRPELTTAADLGIDPPTDPGTHTTYARLWEDPLGVAREHQSRSSAKRSLQDHVRTKPYCEKMRSVYEDMSSVSRTLRGFIRKHGCVTILPIWMRSAPFDEDKEDRLRTRYAVVNGLMASDYKLSYPDRMTYAVVPIHATLRSGSKVNRKLVVPIKLYDEDLSLKHISSDATPMRDKETKCDAKHKSHGVVVLWLGETDLGTSPLDATQQVLSQLIQGDEAGICDGNIIFSLLQLGQNCLGTARLDEISRTFERLFQFTWGYRHNGCSKTTLSLIRWFLMYISTQGLKNSVDIAILGPTDSDTLENVNAEWRKQKSKLSLQFKDYRSWYIYSPRATAYALERSVDSKVEDLHVVHVIRQDKLLACKLQDELVNRDAWAKVSSSVSCVGENRPSHPLFQCCKKHIVLITERDTYYGREFPRTFGEVFHIYDEKDHASTDGKSPFLHVFRYLRGLDGQTPNEHHNDNAGRPSHYSSTRSYEFSQTSEVPAPPTRPHPAPTGQHQLDYLERLGQQLHDLQISLEHNDAEISAIGVVGSDVYDKLLILRALRRQFPGVVFFTTDLSADLASPNEFPSSRNVVVATHFGLTLSPIFDSPSFRDSYQTSTYLACRTAIRDEKLSAFATKVNGNAVPGPDQPEKWANYWGDVFRRIPPLVFEIGRHGPFQMTIVATAEEQNSKYNESRDQATSDTRQVAIAIQPPVRVYPWIVLPSHFIPVCGFLVFALVTLGYWLSSEWRADQIAWAIGLLTIVILLLSLFSFLSHTAPNEEPVTFTEGISIWPTIYLRLGASVLSVGSILTIWKGMKDGGWLRNGYEEGWRMGSGGENSFDTSHSNEWSTIVLQDRWPRWLHSFFARVFVSSFLFLLVGFGLFRMLPPTRAPFRGSISCWTNSISLYLSVICLIVLVCMVLWTLERFRRLVKAIGSRQGGDKQGSVRLFSVEMSFDYNNDTINDLVARVVLIGKATRRLFRSIIFLPFVVLFLMFLARLNYFDNWGYPAPVMIIDFLIILLLVGIQWWLHNTATDAREHVLEALHKGLTAQLKSLDKARPWKEAIAQVNSERRGVFQSWYQNPIIQSLGGLATLTLLVQILLPYI